ncbi:MAG: GNAT family N-acetyltransferase [Spirochaetales bacterium]|nr:GNAT family N-acetyltransferase [Spirochaetales bacterium]
MINRAQNGFLNKNKIEMNEIKLRDININDDQELFEIYSDPKVCEYFDFKAYTNLKEAQDQILKWENLKEEKKQIRYGIDLNNKLIGTCGIYSIYWHQERASLGYDLNSNYWNKGIMTKSIIQLLKKIKKEYNLHRIQATVLEGNTNSKKVLHKIGFEKEGILRDYEKWQGHFVNLEIYSKILRSK